MLEFDGGRVARLTCSIVAPPDRSLHLMGETGTLSIDDVWDYHSPTRISGNGLDLRSRVARRLDRRPSLKRLLAERVEVRHGRRVSRTGGGHRMDFSRGVSQLASQLEGAPLRMGPNLAAHITEATLALASAERVGARIPIRTEP